MVWGGEVATPAGYGYFTTRHYGPIATEFLMFDFSPPPGIGWLWTIFAFIGAFGILGALIWVNVLIGGLVNAMVMLVAGPLIDKQLKNQKLVALLGRLGLKDLT
jgi:hypothetical protein